MATVEIKGTVVSNDDKWIYDWFGYEAVSPSDVTKALQNANGEDVTIQINSGGGDVFAGNEINYLISQYPGNTTADIVGIAASIATVICCGADKVRAVAGAQYMIHNVSGCARGDYNTMNKMSDILKNANKTISNTYRLKTNMSEKDLLSLMNKETWLDVTKAMEYGFIDEVIGDEKGKLTNISLTNGVCNILSEEVKNKIRNTVKSENNPDGNQTDLDFLLLKNKEQAQINLLRMRGNLL